ncbi:hypothetical protein Dimus_035590 [Dionaea muscipula]
MQIVCTLVGTVSVAIAPRCPSAVSPQPRLSASATILHCPPSRSLERRSIFVVYVEASQVLTLLWIFQVQAGVGLCPFAIGQQLCLDTMSGACLQFCSVLRKLEQDMETVVRALQPGPLGIVEHKYTAQDIQEANDTVQRAVMNWRRRANLEKKNSTLKDYIEF